MNSDTNVQKHPTEASILLKEKSSFFGKIPKRYFVTGMCFFAQIVVTMQRINLVVAIVAMVNSTAAYNNDLKNVSKSMECPHNDDDSPTNVKYQGEFLWDPLLQGFILGAFGYGQVTGQLLSGRLAEKFGGKRVMGACLITSSFLTFLTPLTASWNVYALIALRIILGTLLGSGSTVSSFLIGNWIPKSERSVHSSVMMSGTAFGPAIGVALSGLMCASSVLGGWPLTFYSFGGIGCLWFALWMLFIHESPEDHPTITDDELKYILSNTGHDNNRACFSIPWKKMLTSIPFWVLLIAHFGQFWVVGFFNTVHVLFMSSIINMPIKENAALSSLPHLSKGVMAWVCSFPADWVIRKKYASSTTVRKAYVFTSSVAFSLCFLGITLAGCDQYLNASLFIIAFATNALMIPGTVVACIDLAPDFRGTVTGIIFAVGTSSSFIIPSLVGHFTEYEQTMAQWNIVFYISIAISMGTALIFVLFGSAETQTWGKVTAEDLKAVNSSQQSQKDKAAKISKSGSDQRNAVLLKLTKVVE